MSSAASLSERKAAFRSPPGRINECHGTGPVQHPVIDDHRHDFERCSDAHHELLQVPHEDIGRADVVDARERKPQIPANRLQGPVHHHVAVARGRAQQNVVIKWQLVIPKEPQTLALESALDGARLGDDLRTDP